MLATSVAGGAPRCSPPAPPSRSRPPSGRSWGLARAEHHLSPWAGSGYARRVLRYVLALCIACGGEAETPAEPSGAPLSAEWIDPNPTFTAFSGFWDVDQAAPILERAERLEVVADTSSLTADEREALARLIEVGEIFDALYREQLHPQARAVGAHLDHLVVEGEEDRARLDALRELYRLFQGPIATELDGDRVAFAPVVPYEAARNVYPSGASRGAIEHWARTRPRSGVLDVRTLVRARTRENVLHDRALFTDYPALAVFHPRVREMMRQRANPTSFYAIPYTLAYADENREAFALLTTASDLVRPTDVDFADYLEQRARDLFTNDYEAGDAAWITGRFVRLNAQIGAYETYPDHLLAQKAFYSMSILIRSTQSAEELERAVAHLPEFENALPGGPYERVRNEIPIGIYDVIADFGQARGANTASILPNEEHVIRKYGRTILIRRNILLNPAIVAAGRARWNAVIAEPQAADLGDGGTFDRTVWHEVGHYLGPKRTVNGRDVTDALGNLHNTIEELKADLIALWLVPRHVVGGMFDETRGRSVYAAGILRVLVRGEPPRTDAYGTMQLMQQNWLIDRRVLSFDGHRLTIDYAAYPQAVEAMLGEVLRIQRAGDREAAQAFVERWARWDPAVQGVIGAAIDAVAPRYWRISYPALEARDAQ
jgi:hypothetical protein